MCIEALAIHLLHHEVPNFGLYKIRVGDEVHRVRVVTCDRVRERTSVVHSVVDICVGMGGRMIRIFLYTYKIPYNIRYTDV
jgi:hypothetical protein